MSLHRIIYFRPEITAEPPAKDHVFANVHLIRCYTQRRICDYEALRDVLRETFPDAPDDCIYCGVVIRSHYCDGGTLLRYDNWIPKGNYPDWRISTVPPDYTYA